MKVVDESDDDRSFAESEAVIVTAFLFVRPGQEEAFRRFEELALGLLSDHEGQVLGAARLSSVAQKDKAYEQHVLRFATLDHFERYRSDPRHTAWAELRKRVIEKTEVHWGTDVSGLFHKRNNDGEDSPKMGRARR